jgi:hypothetical protein
MFMMQKNIIGDVHKIVDDEKSTIPHWNYEGAGNAEIYLY